MFLPKSSPGPVPQVDLPALPADGLLVAAVGGDDLAVQITHGVTRPSRPAPAPRSGPGACAAITVVPAATQRAPCRPRQPEPRSRPRDVRFIPAPGQDEQGPTRVGPGSGCPSRVPVTFEAAREEPAAARRTRPAPWAHAGLARSRGQRGVWRQADWLWRDFSDRELALASQRRPPSLRVSARMGATRRLTGSALLRQIVDYLRRVTAPESRSRGGRPQRPWGAVTACSPAWWLQALWQPGRHQPCPG